jgi:magnesium chelatase subunit I
MADLIGDIDPIKLAEGRYMSDEAAIHYGLIPRANRGIFAINELPDLPERIQVGLFNLMEERDIQIRGYNVRLPLDVYLVASANPEDYTNRGRIITPLKDRFGARVRTHYPRTVEEEVRILDQERARFPNEERLDVPRWMKEIVAEITLLARQNSEVNQRSGVSVRTSISNYETLISNALRRAIKLNEAMVTPRISDLPALSASFSGKVELEGFEEEGQERVLDALMKKAVQNVFQRHIGKDGLDPVVSYFDNGLVVEAGSDVPASAYAELLNGREALTETLRRLGVNGHPEAIASAMEFVLEGLHLNKRLNRQALGHGFRYGK